MRLDEIALSACVWHLASVTGRKTKPPLRLQIRELPKYENEWFVNALEHRLGGFGVYEETRPWGVCGIWERMVCGRLRAQPAGVCGNVYFKMSNDMELFTSLNCGTFHYLRIYCLPRTPRSSNFSSFFLSRPSLLHSSKLREFKFSELAEQRMRCSKKRGF